MFKYSKYQGLGNDFIICQDKDLPHHNYSLLAYTLCNDETHGPTDGFISVKTNPLEMIFYNRDGSIGSMCGNGLRCFVRYCYDNKIISCLDNIVKTKAGLYETKITSTNPFMVSVNMGKPSFDNDILEIKTNKKEFINEVIEFDKDEYKLTSLFMGVHHTVIYVDDVKEVSEELGHFMCHLPIFKDRTNVDFVSIIDDETINVRTYERGVGFTLACGTGACASFYVSHMLNKCSSKVKVIFEKGSLDVELIDNNVFMEGPSELIFQK